MTLGTPGLSTFSAQSITLGGAQTTGPISIAGGAGEIEVLSPSDVAVTAGTGAVFNVAGASVAVRAPTVSLEAPAGSNNLSANRVTLYGGVFLANTMQACHIFNTNRNHVNLLARPRWQMCIPQSLVVLSSPPTRRSPSMLVPPLRVAWYVAPTNRQEALRSSLEELLRLVGVASSSSSSFS